jgi:ribosome-associated translation inhibitor RaiA
MSPIIALVADILVGVLLVATISTSIVLARRIERLKADENAMRQTIGELITATDTAERAIAGLRLTLGDCDRTLGERLRTAERYASDLAHQVEAGQTVVSRIAQIVEATRQLAPASAAPAESSSTKMNNAADMAAAITERAVRRLESRAA